MKVVIVGAGAVGYEVARQLIDEKLDVVIIERDRDVAERTSARLDCMMVNEDATKYTALTQADIRTADIFISVTGSDEVNMITCGMVTGEVGDSIRTIARIRNIEYNRFRDRKGGFLGIDYVINPEFEAARSMLTSIHHGAMSDVLEFADTDVQLRSMVVPEGSRWTDRSLRDLSRMTERSFLVSLIVRDGEVEVPGGASRIQPGDVIYVAAREPDFDELLADLGTARRDFRRITIVGGGKIGQQLLEDLSGDSDERPGFFARLFRARKERRRVIRVIDRDYRVCKMLSERFPQALVINADVSDEGAFEEEGFQESDLLCAVTGNQELNIVSAIYARRLGAGRVLALVNKLSYTQIAAQLGIDVSISLKQTVARSILRHVRTGIVRSVHSLSDGKLEVLQLAVAGGAPSVGRSLAELRLPQSSLVISVLRSGQARIPDGSLVIQPEDEVIAITSRDDSARVQRAFLPAP